MDDLDKIERSLERLLRRVRRLREGRAMQGRDVVRGSMRQRAIALIEGMDDEGRIHRDDIHDAGREAGITRGALHQAKYDCGYHSDGEYWVRRT